MTEVAAVLEDRVAIVTGGARGIGAAISGLFKALGARVLVADCGASIDGKDSDAGVAESFVAELGEGALAFTEDMGSPTSAGRAVEMAMDQWGTVDILVNNAAILRDAFVFKGDPADWDAVIRNNLSAAYYLINAATPAMRVQAKEGRETGRIINIVSTAGFYGNYGQAAYASAKAGLLGLTRVTALDMARSKVTANAIAPFAATRVTETIKPQNPEQEEYKKRAMSISADWVARFAAYLASDFGQEVSGQLFGVRGREVMLFSQARPVARFESPSGELDMDFLAVTVADEFAGKFTDAATDLEAFSYEPKI